MNRPPDALITRHLEQVIVARLRAVPVLVLTGPRTVGKSTLLRACARSHGAAVNDLDDLPTRRLVAEDPTFFAAAPGRPVFIDEFQHVPEILDAIKAELNRDASPGRYVLTGSTRYGAVPRMSQSLTGRVHVMTLWPLSQGELSGHRETFLDALVTEPAGIVTRTPSSTSRSAYEKAILAGGFPMLVGVDGTHDRQRWYRDYVNTIIDRDVLEIRRVRQRRVLPIILRHLAARTGSVVQMRDLGASVQLDNRLVGDYVTLLESVFLVHRLQAFGRTLSSRVTKSPKVHMVDTGLAGHLLGLTAHKLGSRDPAALTEFGRLVKTFAANELIRQAGWAGSVVEFSHFRTKDGHEVDLVVESEDGSVAAVEVKAKSSIDDKDFRGLRELRDRLGTSFVGGFVINLGQLSFRHDDRLYVAPLDRLRTPVPAS